MKTPPRKVSRTEGSLRLRTPRTEQTAPSTEATNNDDEDYESDLPIRGRPSKKLLLQQQQQKRQFQVRLQPELKTVVAASIARPQAGRSKARRSLYKKGINNSNAQKTNSESYVMRLFERSLDLSKYNETTPLYPICRAWMANQPRNPHVAIFNTDDNSHIVKREDDGKEMLEKLLNGELKTVKQLPRPLSTELSPIPTPLSVSKEEERQARRLQGATKSQLMEANLKHWKKVRGHWLKHAHLYEHERYNIIDNIMEAVCRLD